MRRMITALAALLLAVTSVQGTYFLALEATWPPEAPDTHTIGLTLYSDGQPSAAFGDSTFLGAQTALLPLPAGWSISNLVYNTVDFDSMLIVPGSSLAGSFGIAADLNLIGGVGYTSKKTLLSFTLTAPTPGPWPLGALLDPAQTSVVDSQFNPVYVGPGDVVIEPEPATALLLIAALPLLRRRPSMRR